jgi:hypothetical protein
MVFMSGLPAFLLFCASPQFVTHFYFNPLLFPRPLKKLTKIDLSVAVHFFNANKNAVQSPRYTVPNGSHS